MIARILAYFGYAKVVVTVISAVELGAQYFCGACRKNFYYMDVVLPNYCPLCGAKHTPEPNCRACK